MQTKLLRLVNVLPQCVPAWQATHSAPPFSRARKVRCCSLSRRRCRCTAAQPLHGRHKRRPGRESAGGRLWCVSSPAERSAAAAVAEFAGCFDSIPSALTALAAGEAVVVLDDEARENEGDLIMAADKARSRPCSEPQQPVC